MAVLAAFTAAIALRAGAAESRVALADEGRMPELDGSVAWLNSDRLSAKSLRGKVVLVNFWTYSCINSLRELPYIQGWADKYAGAGLVVVGVHAPEFGFEKDQANVANAVRELKITFPVPVDSNHLIWQAFRNEYWPADYLIDAGGRIRYHHFGEGDYDVSERAIRTLLEENGAIGLGGAPVVPPTDGVEATAIRDVRSPETYAGYLRAERFASREHVAEDVSKTYSLPASLSLNQWALAGSWKIAGERAELHSDLGSIAFRFHARDVHMVLSPAKEGHSVRFRVNVDGAAPDADHGSDSAPDGSGEVREPRLYQLIRQKGRIQDRTFEIEFLDPGVEVFTFTFG
jgi:thiol-disulfide isomerase/thioredoxin